MSTNTLKTSALSNELDIPQEASGTGSSGSSAKVARADHVHPVQIDVSGSAGTADHLTSEKIFTLNGDITGSVSTDLSDGLSINTKLTLPISKKLVPKR